MQRNKKKAHKANNSNFSAKKVQRKENPIVKTLQKVQAMGGTITYFYTKESKVWDEDTKEWVTKNDVTARLHSDINPEVFHKLVDGKLVRRAYEEVLQVFEDTMRDNGADYFEIG